MIFPSASLSGEMVMLIIISFPSLVCLFTSILGALFLFGAFALGWVNRTPESSNLEARARAEQLRQAQSTEWWVESVEPPAAPEATDAGAPSSLQR